MDTLLEYTGGKNKEKHKKKDKGKHKGKHKTHYKKKHCSPKSDDSEYSCLDDKIIIKIAKSLNKLNKDNKNDKNFKNRVIKQAIQSSFVIFLERILLKKEYWKIENIEMSEVNKLI